MSTQDVEVLAPPSDGVSCLRFGTRSQLLVSSWDATLRVYDGLRQRSSLELGSPILSCCYGQTEVEAFAGGLDCTLKQIDLNTRHVTQLSTHAAAVRRVGYSSELGLIVSGGWDGAVRVFDVRNGNNAQIHESKLPGKVFGLDVRRHMLAVATSERQVSVFDLRNLAQPLVSKESPLKYQLRCVNVFSDLTGYALASIEGRVALEYFDDDPSHKRSYAFKCHRGKVDEQTLVYPVNCIAFHPTYGTFATGGCDGIVNLWDGANKKRITHLRQYPTSIAAMDFNHDGSVLAIAASYTYEQGEKDHPNDSIFLHTVQDSEVRPKNKAAA
ncbi:mitotic checkpoint [Plasmopara halstedii]|uniref:Mitotic checkpoint n=1 Tax=Plasmopara halstedii TaxID=4781 RepID=A0A0P1A6H6_PLAHL|nr:mitotic checkpoint [Plasmopara halstedii]CEG36002.1 mitotic checkpoint [Plasmopara halstedii]|eukprot:XP_024572371.1 mitotic checkpoint [Plasmopara halstedii]